MTSCKSFSFFLYCIKSLDLGNNKVSNKPIMSIGFMITIILIFYSVALQNVCIQAQICVLEELRVWETPCMAAVDFCISSKNFSSYPSSSLSFCSDLPRLTSLTGAGNKTQVVFPVRPGSIDLGGGCGEVCRVKLTG